MQRDKIDNEYITSPCGHHVKVCEGSQTRPEEGTSLHGLDPQIVGQQQREDGYTFVIVRTSDGTGNVT